MYLGVDYYPEHWPVEMIDEDLARIKKTGANVIRIGEFAWHMMEKREGHFDFSFFDAVVKKASDAGLKIIFGTPTATFPAWLAHMDESVLSKDENGLVRVFGGRRQYCFNSDVYRKYAARISKKLVGHYSDCQAIVAWQIDNEFGHEGSDDCFCRICKRSFREFLKDKYEDIDALNEAYGTIFWGQTYNSFDEIPAPMPTITTHNPALKLDWARFRSESINSFASEQIAIVRKHKGKDQLVTHNYFGGYLDRKYDQSRMSENLDIVSYDNYPVWGGLEKPIKNAHIAFGHDYMRGLKQKNFWIMEELMGAQGHDIIGYLPRPNQCKLWSYQAMARGCNSLLYFRWRGMDRGAEQFCQGILDCDNEDNRKLEEVSSFFEDIKNYEACLDSEIEAEIALLYDYDSRWSWHYQRQSQAFDYTNEALRLYEPFYNLNADIDVIPSDRDISNYKAVLVPVMQIIDEETCGRLKDFVRNGGVIIFSFRSGIKDKNNNLMFKSKPPNLISELCGISVEEYESLATGVKCRVSAPDLKKTHEASVFREMMVADGAKVMLKYADEPYSSYAAVSVNDFGLGKAYYIGCGIEGTFMDELAVKIVKDKGIGHIRSQEGLEIVRRKYKGWIFEFIMNHNNHVVEYEEMKIGPYETKVINWQV